MDKEEKMDVDEGEVNSEQLKELLIQKEKENGALFLQHLQYIKTLTTQVKEIREILFKK